MDPIPQSNGPAAYAIESFGNGLFYHIIRLADGASVFLQGDDALRLSEELDRTTDRCTDDDVVSELFA